MIIALIITTTLYWAAVAADILTTRAAIARGAGREGNPRYVAPDGRVLYAKGLRDSLVTWGVGAAATLIVPFPYGVVGLVWIAVRGAFRLKVAIHNHRLGRA